MLTETGTLARIFDTFNALPPEFQNAQTRANLFAALEASEMDDRQTRQYTWEKVRYYAVRIDGVHRPLYMLMPEPYNADPYASGAELPTFGAIMAALNYITGAAGN